MALKSETKEQIALFDWIRLRKDIEPYAFYIPNDGKRSKLMGWLMKKMGMKPGVSDIFIGIPVYSICGHFHGMFIELKAKDSKGIFRKPTEQQIIFQVNMRHKNYYCIIANGADEAIKKIEEYLKLISYPP